MKKFLSSLLIISCLQVFSQTSVGEFTSHSALHSFKSIAIDETTVYAATSNSLLLLEKSTLANTTPSFSVWSKVEGLSDIDIVKIYYFKLKKTLLIAYENGNIDLIQNDKILNIRDIKDKSVSTAKTLSNCYEFGDNAMLVFPFGIVVLDLNDKIILDTWFTKRENRQFTPSSITKDNQKWYISTNEGIYSNDISSSSLSNFSVWTKETGIDASFLAEVDNKIFACKRYSDDHSGEFDSIYVKRYSDWISLDKGYRSVRNMYSQNDTLLVCDWDNVELLNGDLDRIFLASWYGEAGYPDARDAVLDGDNILVADYTYGVVQNNMTFYYNKCFSQSGPYFDYVERMDSKNGIVAAVHGSRKGSSAFAPAYKYPAISWQKNGEWFYNSSDFVTFNPQNPAFDLTDVAINPNDDSEWYVASWGNGLFKMKNDRVVAHYNARNSILDSTQYGLTFVSGLKFDSKGNLWMTNSQVSNMLVVLTKNGEWYSYNIGSGVISSTPMGVVAENLVIDSYNNKWVNFPRDAAFNRYNLVAFSDNGTLDNKTDDKLARIDMNVAAEVSSSRVFCMAEDLDGELWIGTDKGVKVIYYPNRVFSGNAYPRNILLEQDGYVSVLLEYEEVTAIAVDGANRKWIGTSKAGVFLMSENGQEELLHFTAEDNPLFSNQIVSICINHTTGDVFFATAKGLVSYRGTATSGQEHYEDLLVFPNPVPHDYSGYVSVRGLKEKSLCKITDSSGKLVWQGYSDGGQLVWDCKDHFGQRPATGVYYVMISDKDGKEKIVTKFVFVN